MDLELSPRVTLQYMILQLEKEFQRIHRKPDKTVHASPGCPKNSESYMEKYLQLEIKGAPLQYSES